ncbi:MULTISPECIES: biotin--[acetyl-CoA-carboxylase] ligase [unclassified Candidatus Frackibacter]|uniref:biotin--[acetyl-CoA-carboxylase] ligase n=1 Tax=unclassified Candidatus Frackibacter TaxID=2648818 RepID=UPI000796E07B|nr:MULTISPECIES: biotin--[acetyl-CoA-carboxylase] ligase [unclassified Candidatus Frackibacter]KXS42093.1 MAG: BirA family transcriptional regulator [Candidatus Frackibacter sp. T328-2]SDC84787.1 BirA family transcriptional regulator, biotin operon repressor / biotin-[acetyl-CoA-carboxylase] ligase [Candidatus Frackibacter sp. WG11]SEM99222.1 BirA family transcriptional regulator, biotin operon repressor / biotin-[acetyl-CoA-carboxylase] ligase [Candidatus Frackibacter sp. WG12]SFM07194.1 BirA 
MTKTSERKQQVLEILHNTDDYISGQELSDKFGVSRTTIWKYIKGLREQGYQIESSSKLGYRLIKAPDILSPEEIKRDLETKILGREIIYQERVDSTNNLAETEARKGAKEGTVIIAKEQTGGKGRLNREYFCPPGGIWFSVILRPEIKPAFASQLNFIIAVALAKTIDKLTKLEPGIKWPNDILINGKKVSGILTEMNAEIDKVNHIILGVGINLNIPLVKFPNELLEKATSIQEELGRKVLKLDFFLRLLAELENEYIRLKEEGFKSVLTEWREYNVTLGQKVNVNNMREILTGRAIDVDDEGGLILELDSGDRQRVVAGDVTLEGEYL